MSSINDKKQMIDEFAEIHKDDAQIVLSDLAHAYNKHEHIKFFETHKIDSKRMIYPQKITDFECRHLFLSYVLYEMDLDVVSPAVWFDYVTAIDRVYQSNEALAKADASSTINMIRDLERTETNKHVVHALRSYDAFFQAFDPSKSIFDLDRWDLYVLPIADSRKSPSNNVRHLNFGRIDNDDNRRLVKKYFQYLILQTDKSLKTIKWKLTNISKALNTNPKPYTAWNADDVRALLLKLGTENLGNNRIGAIITNLNQLTVYLLANDYLDSNPLLPYLSTGLKWDKKALKRAPEGSIIEQIFKSLPQWDDIREILIFLILFCTGCRLSEAVTTKRNCLSSTLTKNGEVFYIKMYSNKMKKDIASQIPKSLYEMIADYRNSISMDSEYLFPSVRRKQFPMSSETFRKDVRGYMKKFNVKNPDGTPYAFQAHGLRHLEAVRMRETGVPWQFIQYQLEHRVGDMTAMYLEYFDDAKIKSMRSWYDINGQQSPVDFGDSHVAQISSDDERAIFLRKSINAQVLPTGICARAVKLGPCPHGNACYDCPSFRTSPSYISAMRSQLHVIEQCEAKAKENGWTQQVHTYELDKAKLLRLIKMIEEKVTNDDTEQQSRAEIAGTPSAIPR